MASSSSVTMRGDVGMKPDDRRQEIVELLIESGSVGLDDLAARFGVSRMTIHRDLDDLEAAGLLRKVRGGATIEASSQFESDFRYRERKATDEKQRIARRAIDLVEPGQSVLLDDSSTAGAMAALLPERRPLTVITNNLQAIGALAGAAGISLIALGGAYSKKFHGFFGLVTEQALRGLRADVAFLSTSAIQGAIAYHQDQEVVQTKRLMIEAASRRYLLVDREKFGRTALHYMSDLGAFDAVITGARPDAAARGPLADAGVDLIVAAGEDPS